MRNDRENGFTLIELMIVIAIISILAAILIPNFLHARAESQTYSCEGNLRQLATAMEEYAVDNGGQYPGSVGQLTAANGGVYLKNVPVDPSGGAYTIVNTASGPCGALGSNATFTITDGDQHDPTTGSNLRSWVSGNRGIDYCAGTGLVSVP
jgi:prepilin-type N-terminal cleavage/methylation domain-containing protein